MSAQSRGLQPLGTEFELLETPVQTPIPDPRIQPTMSVPDAGRYFGLGRDSSYAAAKRGDIPTLRIGRRLVVPTASVLAILGLSDD